MMKHKSDLQCRTFALYSLTAFLLVFLLTPSFSTAESLDDQVNEISFQLMCPVCQGQSVAESNSNLAHDMRQIIRKKLQEGESREEIIQYFVDSYGESILASPPAKGVNWLLWILPAVAIVFGVVAAGMFLHKSGSGRSEVESKESEASGPESDYMKRIDEELKKQDS